MTIQPGQTLLHYRLVEKIGEGGMGVVWKALDTTLDREVAIKVLSEAIATTPDRLVRFDREAKKDNRVVRTRAAVRGQFRCGVRRPEPVLRRRSRWPHHLYSPD